MGTSSGTRLSACSSSSAIGSGRSGAGSHRPWLDLGACLRASRPLARRSSTVRCCRLQDDANGALRAPSAPANPVPVEYVLVAMLVPSHAVSPVNSVLAHTTCRWCRVSGGCSDSSNSRLHKVSLHPPGQYVAGGEARIRCTEGSGSAVRHMNRGSHPAEHYARGRTDTDQP